jgi:hypothetical protein
MSLLHYSSKGIVLSRRTSLNEVRLAASSASDNIVLREISISSMGSIVLSSIWDIKLMSVCILVRSLIKVPPPRCRVLRGPKSKGLLE